MSKTSIQNFFQPTTKKLKTSHNNNNELEDTEVPKKEEIVDLVDITESSSSHVVSLKPATSSEMMTNESTEWDHLKYLDDNWKATLSKEFTKPYFKSLQSYVDRERANNKVFPSVENTFNAFNSCPFDHLKVVIIGQDPYHGDNQAHGLAFSVLDGISPPPSLMNIFKEAMNDVGTKKPKNGNLLKWSQQGVLLLNTCLTVRKAEPNSHQKQGFVIFLSYHIHFQLML